MTSDILAELEAKTAETRPGTPCRVRVALARLEPDKVATMAEAIRRRDTITATVLSAYFKEKFAIEVGDQSIRTHRAGKCKCPTS